GQLRCEYREPEPQHFVLSEGKLQLYQPMQKQLIIQDARQYFLSDIPVTFLLGLGDLEKSFRLQSGCREENQVAVELVSSEGDADRALRQFTVVVDVQEDLPIAARVVDREGNRTTLFLNK